VTPMAMCSGLARSGLRSTRVLPPSVIEAAAARAALCGPKSYQPSDAVSMRQSRRPTTR
jgi:hypothetical protein